MTAYKTGRSTDYQGSETPSKRYAVRPYENTTDIIDQFERMHKGLVPVCSDGAAIVWVQDSTLTPEDREWCWQTARQIERDGSSDMLERAFAGFAALPAPKDAP